LTVLTKHIAVYLFYPALYADLTNQKLLLSCFFTGI